MIMKKESLQQAGRYILPYGIAFLLAFIIGVITYIVLKIAPFGDKTIICLDLWAQYLSMYAEKLQTDSFSDLLYSWNGGFGFNNWAQSAYYCNSIFLLLLPLTPMSSLVGFINWLPLFKIGLSAVTCLGLLQYKTKSRSPILVGGAVAYATCAYMLAFIQQLMWTDCVIYVPLLLIGLDMLMYKKKPLLYTCMLALIIITNFYIGFAVCIFCCLYFAAAFLPAVRFEKNSENLYTLSNPRETGFFLLRFAGFSLLGGAMAAIVILPIGLAISQTISSGLSAPEELEWYGNISYILQNMLPEREVFIGFDGFNLSVGIAAFVMVPLYFFNRNISVSERIANGCLLLILGFSLVCNYLDFFWHGMHFPNQLPARWSFLFSLMIILLSCKAAVNLRGVKLSFAAASIGIGVLAVILGVVGFGKTESAQLGAIHWIVLVLTAVLLIALLILSRETMEKSAKKDGRKTWISVCSIAVTALMVLDSGYSFVTVYKNIEGSMAPRDGEYYSSTSMKEYTWGNAYKSGEDEFYRVEAAHGYIYNSSMIGDYHGMTYYSSTMREPAFDILRYLGNRVYAENVSSIYNPTSPVQNSLFGIRYYLDFAKTMEQYMPGISAVEKAEDCDVYENNTALGLGYAVSENILDLNITDEVRAIANQNNFLNLLCGEEQNVYEMMLTTSFYYENLTMEPRSNWNTNYFRTTDMSMPAKFYYTYTCEKDGAVYLESNYRTGTMMVTWEGGSKQIDTRRQKYDSLGFFKKGDVISIVVSLENVSLGCCGLNLYYFNEEAWQNAYEQLAAEQLNVETFENTYVKGSITVAEDRLVMTTIPQDGGWEVYCDGEKTEPVIIAGELIGINVPAGTHTLEFRYHVPGFAAGAVISILGLLVTLCLCSKKLRAALEAKLPAAAEDHNS